MNHPVTTAIRLARLPSNGIERHVVATNLIPHLRPGENVDTGALRVLADEVAAPIMAPRFPAGCRGVSLSEL